MPINHKAYELLSDLLSRLLSLLSCYWVLTVYNGCNPRVRCSGRWWISVYPWQISKIEVNPSSKTRQTRKNCAEESSVVRPEQRQIWDLLSQWHFANCRIRMEAWGSRGWSQTSGCWTLPTCWWWWTENILVQELGLVGVDTEGPENIKWC